MQDRERIVQSGDRLDQLVARARADLEANPGVPPKIIALADALAKREQPKQEDEAVALLLGAYKDLGDYTFKRRADDLRIKQMTREARRIVASKDRDAAQRHLAKQLTFEIEVFSERVKQYPTDSGLKYQLAQRMLRAKRIDDAIPLFQEARGDAKHRVQANVSIGRCFFEKGYYPQAINTFTEVIREYEMPGDEVSKEMHYWLGRSYEAADKKDEAVETYGHLIELDYNYKDVRERLDALSKHEE